MHTITLSEDATHVWRMNWHNAWMESRGDIARAYTRNLAGKVAILDCYGQLLGIASVDSWARLP